MQENENPLGEYLKPEPFSRTPQEAMQNLKDILGDYPDLLQRTLELTNDDMDAKRQLEKDIREALGDEGFEELVDKTNFVAAFKGRFDIGVSPSVDAESLMSDGDAYKLPVPGLASLYKTGGAFNFDLYELPEKWKKNGSLFDAMKKGAKFKDSTFGMPPAEQKKSSEDKK